MDIPQEEYEKIESMIKSEDSPVGIDAVKTHVFIIHKLLEIDKRLKEIEAKIG